MLIWLFWKWLQMKNWGHFRRNVFWDDIHFMIFLLIVSLDGISDSFKLIDCKFGVVRQAKRNLVFSKMSLGAVSWICDIKNSFPKLLFWLFLLIILILLILTTVSNVVFNLTSGVQLGLVYLPLFSRTFSFCD